MIGFTKLGLAGLVLSAMPVLASAHSRFDVEVGGPFAPPPPVVVVAPPPTDRVWVEPVYQTETDHVWRDAVTEDRCTRVWVRDAYVEQVFGHGRHERVEQVFVPGHYEDRHEAVVVAPGHWEDVQRQVLVTPGHWAERPVDCAPRVVEVAPAPFLGFFGRFHF